MTTSANVSMLARLRMQVSEWSAGAKQARGDLDGIKSTFDQNRLAARAAGVAFTAALGGGILLARQAVQAYSSFGQAIQNVASVAGASAEDFERLRTAALSIGAGTRLTADQAAEALYNLASAGFDTAESIDALDGVTNLALATLSDLGTASSLVTSTITQFGLAADEAGRVADVFANAIAASPANMERLTTAMRNAGPFAAALGLSLEETTAAVSTLFKAGLEGGQAGASIRFFMSALLNPTEQARSTLERLGLTMAEVNPQIVGVAGAVEALEEAGLTTADALELFSTRGATAFLSLKSQGADAIRELTEEVSQSGTAARIAQEQMNTFAGSTENLASSIQGVRISIGGFLARVLRPFVDGLTFLVDLFNRLPAPIQAGVAALTVLLGAVTAAAVAFVTFGGVLQSGFGRLQAMLALVRGAPAAFLAFTASVRTKTVAVLAATRATLGLAAAQARLTLANLAPGRVIQALGNLTRSLIATTLATIGFNRAATGATPALGRLGVAVRAFFRILNANPIIRVVTLALGALLLVVEGVRRNVGGLGDAWAEIIAAFEPAREAFRATAEALRGPLTEGLAGLRRMIETVAPLIVGVLTLAARGLAIVMVSLAGSIRQVGIGLQFLQEVFAVGPIQAARNFAERSRQAFDETSTSIGRLVNAGARAAGSLDDVADSAEGAADSARGWVAELTRANSELRGDELVEELTRLLEAYQDNAQAVESIAEALVAARDRLKELREEAEEFTKTFGDRLGRIAISLIEDDEARKIAEVRAEFGKLREEIEAAAAANEEYALTAPAQIAEAYRLESVQIARIRRDARAKAAEDARKEAEELARIAEQREAAILQLTIDATDDRVEQRRLEYLRSRENVLALYEEWEARAKGNADELARLAETRNRELRLLDEAYVQDVREVYQEAFDELSDIGRAALRRALERSGDERGLLTFGLEDQLAEARATFDALEARAQGNARLLAEIAEARDAELLRIAGEFMEDLIALREDGADRIAAAERRVAELSADVLDDPLARERQRYEDRVGTANAFYDTLEARAGDNAAELVRIADLRDKELTLLARQYQATIDSLDATAFAESFASTVDRLTDGITTATAATLDGLQEQLGLWRRTYAGNEGVVALVDEALAEVSRRYDQLSDEAATRLEADRRGIERLADDTERLAERRAQAERRLANLAASTSGEQLVAERARYQERVAQAEAFYDEMVRLAGTNTEELDRIAAMRAQELGLLFRQFQQGLGALGSELEQGDLIALTEALTGDLIDGLDTATRATLRSMREQIAAWRDAYSGNEGVAAIAARALAIVDQRYDALTSSVASRIDSLVQSSQRLVQGVDTRAARAGLSEIESLYADTADRIAEATGLIADLEGQLVDAGAAQRAAIETEIAELNRAIGLIEGEAVDAAQALIDASLDEFDKGLARARERASAAAIDAVKNQLEQVVRDVVTVNEAALIATRARINQLIADLLAAGVTEDALAPLRAQAEQMDALLARIAENQAAFLAQEAALVRRVADAVLTETAARRVRLDTLRAEVDAQARALQSARDRSASLEDMRRATQNLVSAQLQYLDSLRREADALRARQDSIAGVLPALQRLANALGRPTDLRVLDAQRELVQNLFDQVRAAQEAGESFADYADVLARATSAQEEFAATAAATAAQAFDKIADAFARNGSQALLDPRVRVDLDRLVGALGRTFNVTFENARRVMLEQLHSGARELDPQFDFLTDLEARLQRILGPDFVLDVRPPKGAVEAFEALTDEALEAPDAIAAIQVEIEDLEKRVEELRKELEKAIDFEAITSGVLSAYADVVKALERDAPGDFEAIGIAAGEAFRESLSEEIETLEARLRERLGDLANTLGLAAGAGLMNAFADGIRRNREALLAEVRSVLGVVRSYLPSSDAKIGPLSTLTDSGRALVTTFASGIERERRTAERAMARTFTPPVATSTRMSSHPLAAGGGGDTYITLPIGDVPAPSPLAMPAQMMRRAAQREVGIQRRMGNLGGQ